MLQYYSVLVRDVTIPSIIFFNDPINYPVTLIKLKAQDTHCFVFVLSDQPFKSLKYSIYTEI